MPKKKLGLQIRQANRADIPALIELNKRFFGFKTNFDFIVSTFAL